LQSPVRATSHREALRRLKAFFSLEAFPFTILIVLSAISILCRAWLMVRPLLAFHGRS
jgi:hypothetical protein